MEQQIFPNAVCTIAQPIGPERHGTGGGVDTVGGGLQVPNEVADSDRLKINAKAT